MKRIFYSALVAGALLATGCSKEDKKPEPTAEEAALAAEQESLDQQAAELQELADILGEELAEDGMLPEDFWDDISELSDEEAAELIAWAEDADQMPLESVKFAMNSAKLTDAQKEALKYDIKIAEGEIANGKEITFAGHCAPVPSEENNLELSQQRADAVRQVFVDAGLPEEKLHTAAYAATLPDTWSDLEGEARIEALAPNCRTEMIIA